MKWIWLMVLILLLPTAGAVNYPQVRGYVTDNANIIDQPYEEKITQLAQTIEKESTVEIAVVTVESLEGESIAMYAVKFFEQAGIGKKDKDNGLLILVAKNEREYDFEVGYGLEGTITDSMKVNIGDRILMPNFRNGEYGKGIYESMLEIQGLINRNPEVVSRYSMPQGGAGTEDISVGPGEISGLFNILIILVVIFIIFIFIMNASYSRETSWKRKYGYRQTPILLPDLGRGRGGFGGGFGGFGGGRSGGGGFRGKW